MSTKSDRQYYVAKTPGLRCIICGADISGRISTTKSCLTCANKMRQKQDRIVREKTTLLRERDAVQKPVDDHCKVCGSSTLPEFYFCYFCGQRLRKEYENE